MQFINNILTILNFSNKKKLIILPFFILIISLLEICSIAIIIPLFSYLISEGNNISINILGKSDIQFSINSFNNYFCHFFNKKFFIVFINNWNLKFSNEFSLMVSSVLLNNYLYLDYLKFKELKSSELIRNLNQETGLCVKSILSIFNVILESSILILIVFLFFFQTSISIIFFQYF